MKLLRFRAEKVHGYMEFDIKFKDDLNFLTGINGSGKTSALNGIVALITPDLQTLATLRYEALSLQLENNKQKLTILAIDNGDTVTLRLADSHEEFKFLKFTADPDLPLNRQTEYEIEHYRELMTTFAAHSVLKRLAELPTPMFLGLDRRSRLQLDDRHRSRYRPLRWRSSPRNVFGGSLGVSLQDAAELAETMFRDALISTGQIGEELQQEMLLNLLALTPVAFGQLSVPTQSELRELDKVRSDLNELPKIFSLPKEKVEQSVKPFLDRLQDTVQHIPKNTNADQLLKTKSPDSQVVSAIIDWSMNKSQLNRIRVISDTVASYNRRRSEKQEPTKRYLNLVNEFLNDSGKSIDFDDRGYISVNIQRMSEPQPITSLSSGEAQIFVILTHLTFNPLAQSANVFIIDEPELSLHVRWQEIFVQSVCSANPNIQYILATHSPSIIQEKLNYCIDLSKPRRGRSRG